jgi:hypothetical protein
MNSQTINPFPVVDIYAIQGQYQSAWSYADALEQLVRMEQDTKIASRTTTQMGKAAFPTS